MSQPSGTSGTNDTNDTNDTNQQKGFVQTHRKQLLIAVGVAIALFVVARQFMQAPGSGGPAVNTTGQNASPSAPSATATQPPLTKVQGTTVVGVPGPIILLNPGIVRQGAVMSVTGSGFDAGGTVDLVIKQGATAHGQAIGSVHADKNGFFATNFPAPDTLSTGPFLLQAQQRNSHNTAQATGAVSGTAAFVKLGTEVGKVGDVVGWSGTGFQPGETVNVYWDAMGGQPIASYKADGGGNIKATVQIPFAAVGENNLIFIGTKSSSPVTTTFLVLSLYPTVKLSSYALHADNVMTFTGSGFGPNERVLIYLNSTYGAPIATAQADAHGGFKNSGSLLVPFSLKGKQNIIFIGEQSRAPTTAAFSILPYMPNAQASTYGALPGTTISFYAFNFARNEVVHVYVGHTGNMVACFLTDGKGNVGAGGSYVVPSNAQVGKLTFTLTGSKSGATTTAVITVMPALVPVQIPPQPPFTCALDQAQATPTPPAAGGAPGNQPAEQITPPPGATPGNQPNQPPPPPPNQPNQPNQPDQPPPPPNNPPQGRHAQPAPSASRPAIAAFVGLIATTSLVAPAKSTHPVPFTRGGTPAHKPAPGSQSGGGLDRSAVVTIGLISVAAFLTILLLLRLGLRDIEERDIEERDIEDDDLEKRAPDRRRLGVTDESSAGTLRAPDRAMVDSPFARSTSPWRQAATPHHGDAEVPGGVTPTSGESARGIPDNLGAHLVPEVAGLTDAGLKRRGAANEDSFAMRIGAHLVNGCAQRYGLFVVADGIGGHAHGKEASCLAIRLIADYVVPRLAADWTVGSISFTGILKQAVVHANAGLLAENRARRTDMGTTVTAALVVGDTVHIANVGDSRTYVYSLRYGLRQVTTDHSIIAGLVAAGLLQPEAIYSHPRRSQLYRSLGTQGDCQVDTFHVILQPEDRLLLCSDGLWAMVRDPRIEAILRASADPHTAAERLVRSANESGGHDNVTVIVVRMLDQPALNDAHPGIQEDQASEGNAWAAPSRRR